MTFEFQDALWYLAALPIAGIIMVFALRRSLRTIRDIAGDYRRREIIGNHIVRYFILSILFTAAIAALIIAVAEPQWGNEMIEDDREGLEIVFAIDVSNSMRAEDIRPSRLARSRNVARTIAGQFPEAHKAVVIFKGAATVLVPMTEDPVSFELAMSNLSGALITTAGTDIQDGTNAALDAFPTGTPRRQIIVLFSDGEQLVENAGDIHRRLREEDIPVLVVQTGTVGGATIPIPTGDLLRDEDGRPIIAGVDESTLRELAEASDGVYYRITEGTVAQTIVDDIRARTGAGEEVLFRPSGDSRYYVFVLVALALLGGTIVVQSIPWDRDRRWS